MTYLYEDLEKPTRLYIKKCSHCDLKYFGKYTGDNIESYKGSGVRWKQHLKKHNAKSIHLWNSHWYYDTSIKRFALKFSRINKLSSDRKWANIIEEDGIGNGLVNYKHTEETKQKLSIINKGKRTTEKVCLKGDARSEAQILGKKIAAKKRKGNPTTGKNILKGDDRTEAQKKATENLKNVLKGREGPNKGKTFSIEWKEKLKGPRPNARKPKPKLECPHCKKIGGAPQMKRHHFNNCKERTGAI